MLRRERLSYIPQLEAVECGAACLAMVLAYHGHHAPLAEVRERCGVSRDGVSALGIMHAAKSYGMNCDLYRAELEALPDLPLPAILHWEFNHFVVLERMERDGSAWVIDPATGRRRVPGAVLDLAVTGAVLLLEKSPAFVRQARNRIKLGRYRRLLLRHWPSFAQLIAFSLLIQVFGLSLPIAMQFLLDRVLGDGLEGWLWAFGACLALTLTAQTLLQLCRKWVLASLQTTLDWDLLSDFMRHTLSLPLAFFLQRNPGDLLQRLECNRDLRQFFGSQISMSVLDAFLLLGYGTLLVIYQWQVALAIFALGAIRASLQHVASSLSGQATAVELTARSRAGGTLLETLGALETVRAASAESECLTRWTSQVVERENAGMRRSRIQAGNGELSRWFGACGAIVVCLLAGRQVIDGQLSIGVFAALLSLQALFLAPFNSLLVNLGQWQFLRGHLARLEDVVETRPEVSGARDPVGLRGEISMSALEFRYSSGSGYALQGIDLHVKPGERIGVVGRSGAGKSTLVRMLLGMHVPTAGSLAFDGIDIGDYDLLRLRQRMGAVLQESVLMTGSIESNITLLDPDIPLDAVERAMRTACIDTFVNSLPQGRRTLIGEAGMNVSGGERQRICIARALVRDPAILVLDEASSSLDPDVERRIQQRLDELRCTLVVVAHRAATLKSLDRILVLDQGRIVQQGGFEDLLGQPGLFREMFHG